MLKTSFEEAMLHLSQASSTISLILLRNFTTTSVESNELFNRVIVSVTTTRELWEQINDTYKEHLVLENTALVQTRMLGRVNEGLKSFTLNNNSLAVINNLQRIEVSSYTIIVYFDIVVYHYTN